MRRAAHPARAALLGAGAALGMLREDPLLLVVQASRRLPRRVSGTAAALLLAGRPAGRVREVAGHWIAGHRARAAAALPGAHPRGRLGARLLRELAVELAAVPVTALPPGPQRARAAWRAGDLTGALSSARRAGATRLADRYAAELATLDPGFVVPPPGHAAPAHAAPGHAPPAHATPAHAPPAHATPAHAPPAHATAATRPRAAGPARPRVLHLLTNSLPRTQSGYALRSHAVLRAQSAAGVDVLAATRLGYPVTVGRLPMRGCDVVDGIRYARLLPARLPATAVDRAARAVELLAPLARAAGTTVVHTTTPYGNGQVARSLAGYLGVPWVYEVRGLHEQTWVAGLPDDRSRVRAAASERYALLRAQEAAVASAADHVVTLSATLRADLVARGVPAERVTVLPNAVDARLLDLPDVAPATARRLLGLPAGGFWVGTVSSLVAYEGLGTLVDAVALLRGAGLDVRACLVGEGVARPELERRVERAGIADAVLLPGRVPAAEAAAWVRALDVVAVPRRDLAVCRTVTPLKPVEAMALRRPVVASDLPALAEVLSGGAGRLVPADDAGALAAALAALRDDHAARAALVAAGRDVAAGRTWAEHGARYRDLYARLGGTR